MSTGRVRAKTALVTGAASGIGRAAAERLAEEGARVVCTDLDLRRTEGVAEGIRKRGGSAEAAVLDVTDEAAWESVIARAVERGPLDVLVSSAGVAQATPTAETSLDDWRRVLAINLDGVFLGTKHALRHMTGAGRGGSLVHIASATGLRAVAGAAAYSASKAAVIAFSRSVARECLAAGNGIRVNSVCPGGVKTPLWRAMGFFAQLVARHGSEEAAFAAMAGATPAKRFAEPAEIAEAILYLASDESRFVTGTELVVDGGFNL